MSDSDSDFDPEDLGESIGGNWADMAEEEEKKTESKNVKTESKDDSDDDSDSDSEDDWEADIEQASKAEEKLKKEKEEKKTLKAKEKEAKKKEKSEVASVKKNSKFKTDDEGVVVRKPPKKLPKMYQDYNRKLGQIAQIEEFFGDEFEEQPIRIDLLEPKSENDFYEFSRILSEIILKFEDSNHFVRFLKDLNGRACANLKKADVEDIKKNFDTFFDVKKKKSKKATGTNIMGTKSKTSGFEDNLIERADHENADSDSDMGDGDFM